LIWLTALAAFAAGVFLSCVTYVVKIKKRGRKNFPKNSQVEFLEITCQGFVRDSRQINNNLYF
jgi:hypothetical protein